MTQFTDRMKRRRDALHFTQEEAAERAGMTLRKYQRLEGDEFKPKLADAAKLALALDTSTDFLAGNTDDERPLVNESSLSWVERIVRRLSAGDRLGAIRLISDENPPNSAQQTNPQTD